MSLNEKNTSSENIQCTSKSKLNTVEKSTIKPLKAKPKKMEAQLDFGQDIHIIENGVAIRPWIEGDNAKKPLLHAITQFALYKCMHDECIFATDCQDAWKSHMNRHIEENGKLRKYGALGKDMIKYRECSYCGKYEKNLPKAIHHMETEHRRSILQCAHCFYRTNEMGNIEIHYGKFHQNRSREVLLCDQMGGFKEYNHEFHRKCLERNVKKMKCGQRGTYGLK